MAQIPTYGGQAQRENVNLGAPMQQLNAPAAAFGSDGRGLIQAGEGLQKGASVLAAVTSEMNKEKDQRDAAKALVAAQKDINDFSANAYSTTGAGVEGATRNFEAFRDRIRDQALAELTSPRAQAMFTEKFEPHTEAVRGAMSIHEAKELRGANVGAQVALADTARNLAEANYTNANIVNSNIEQVSSATAEAGRLAGKSSTEIGNMVASSVSKTLVQVAGRFIADRNFGAAKGVLADPRLMGDEQKIISEQLKKEELQAEGLRLGNELYKRGLTPLSAQSILNKIPDSGLRMVAEQQFNHLFSTARSEEARNTQLATANIYAAMVRAPDLEAKYQLLKQAEQNLGTPAGKQAYVAARGIYDQYATAGGMSPTSNPSVVFEMQRRAGVGGDLTTEQALTAAYAGKVAPVDIEHAVKQMQGKQNLDIGAVTSAYMKMVKMDENADPAVSLDADQSAELKRIQDQLRLRAVDNKQGHDRNWISGAVAASLAPGRIEGKGFLGFGNAATLSSAKRDKVADKTVLTKPAEGSTNYNDWQRVESLYPVGSSYEAGLLKEYNTKDRDLALRKAFTKLMNNAYEGKKGVR